MMRNFLISKHNLSIIYYFTLFILIFSYNFVMPVDPDLGWHIKYGEQITKTHIIPTKDTFTHSFYGQALVDREWITNILIYQIYENFSFLGLSIFFGMISSLGLFIPALIFKGDKRLKFILIWWCVIGTDAVFQAGARAQNFSFVFFSILITLIIKYLQSKKVRYLFLIPFIFLLWSNIHPGYILGLVTLSIFVFTEIFMLLFRCFSKGFRFELKTDFKRLFILIIILTGSFVCILLSPKEYGAAGLSGDFIRGLFFPANYAISSSVIGSVRMSISEWLPPVLTDLSGSIFLLSIFILFSLYVLKPITKTGVKLLVLVAFITYFSSLARRNTLYIYALFFPVMLLYSDRITFLLDNKIKIIFICLISFLFIINIPSKLFTNIENIIKYGKDETSYCKYRKLPCDLIDHLKKNRMEGNMFNFYDWGGFLIWQLPEYKVFIDGRVPGNDLYLDYRKVTNLQSGWREVIKKYNIKWILMPNNDKTFELINTQFGWVREYADKEAVIYRKLPD
jgi:hypothetical protein